MWTVGNEAEMVEEKQGIELLKVFLNKKITPVVTESSA